MTTHELPAIDWLGYSIDLSRSSTMDLRAVSLGPLCYAALRLND